MLLVVHASAGLGASAVRLILSNDPCLITPCPPTPPPPTVTTSGAVFPIFVLAVDSSPAPDPTFAGTVSFSSSDPLATLPANYTFQPTDLGRKALLAILRSPGTQTIAITSGGLTPGILTMTVNP